jgi:hypothetical protein
MSLARDGGIRLAAAAIERHAVMDPAPPIRHTEGCAIDEAAGCIRAHVGPGLADQVQECYRAFVHECLQRQCRRALVVGTAKSDAFNHLALRDALRSMSVAGLPPAFRIGFVALTPQLIAVYDAAVVEASRCGITARRFLSEAEAQRWLGEP